MKKLTILFVLLVCFNAYSQSQKTVKPSDYIGMENDVVKVQFDREYGSLIYLEYKKTGWKIENRKELSRSFRMLMPAED